MLGLVRAYHLAPPGQITASVLKENEIFASKFYKPWTF